MECVFVLTWKPVSPQPWQVIGRSFSSELFTLLIQRSRELHDIKLILQILIGNKLAKSCRCSLCEDSNPCPEYLQNDPNSLSNMPLWSIIKSIITSSKVNTEQVFKVKSQLSSLKRNKQTKWMNGWMDDGRNEIGNEWEKGQPAMTCKNIMVNSSH